MIRRALLLAGSALSLALAFSASAKGQLQVHGTLMEIGVGEAAGRMTLANTGDVPVGVQVRVFAWSQPDGKDRLTSTSDIVLSPPIVRIPAGGEQVIRLVRQGAAPAGPDQTYRLIVDELPGKPNSNVSSVSLRMRYVVPLYVRAADAKPPLLSCQIGNQNAALLLTCANSGGQAAQLGATDLRDASGTTYPLTPGLFGYVLPASIRRWPLDPKRLVRLGSGLTLETRLNGRPATLPVTVAH